VHIRNKRLWHARDGIHVCGNAFEDHEFKDTIKLIELFANVKSKAGFLSALQHLNGFYAVIKVNNHEVYAAVDRIRSIPLFYGSTEGNAYISDDAHWVRDQVRDEEFSEIAETEFIMAGFVNGSETLYPNVKQVQAGEALIAEYGPERMKISTVRYYCHIHHFNLKITEQELLNRHDEVLLNVFRRLIRWANGRPIAVPLSGGYDSRLIVLMLKRLGYENVIAFSYGRPGDEESAISKELAQHLNIRWEFVPYSNEAWYKWFRTEERKLYYRMADGLSSVPHIQDWPAVWEMKRAEQIPEDAVFVPGHKPYPMAQYIPSYCMSIKYVGKNKFLEIVLGYYKLFELEKLNPGIVAQLRRRIIDVSECSRFDSPEDAAVAIEKWVLQEWRTKFTVNSVRVYEFFGYEWWLPLWDSDLSDFWRTVPLQYKTSKKIYKSYVTQLTKEILGVDLRTVKNPFERPIMLAIKNIARKTGLYKQARSIYRFFKSMNASKEYDNLPLAFYGVMPKEQFAKLYTGHENINSFLALERLGRISFEASEKRS